MPKIEIDIPAAAAQRISDALEYQGFTGSGAEKIAETKRMIIQFLKGWVHSIEGSIIEKNAMDSLTDLDVT